MSDSAVPFLSATTAVRFARPSRDIDAATHFYVELVGWENLGGFRDHHGFDGVFLGLTGASWHLEITQNVAGAAPTPTHEDLLVIYLAASPAAALCLRLRENGCSPYPHENPYWASVNAQCFLDPDGYTVTICPEGDQQ